MIRFSANTGFLYNDMPLPAAVHAAARDGFDAVEFHDEAQRSDLGAVRAALDETGLPLCGLNIRMGETAGCAGLPGYQDRFLEDIRAAERAADALGADAIHVLAGRGNWERRTYIENLRSALGQTGRTILIEPICRAAMPDYGLHTLAQTLEILEALDDPRLRVLFDCFHIEMEQGCCAASFHAAAPRVGHVQIASVPHRAEPDTGRLDYTALLPEIRRAGYEGAFGCEYRPARPGDFTWMTALRDDPSDGGIAGRATPGL